MKVQLWTDQYPTVKAEPVDDGGWGVLLVTRFGNYRIMERDGSLEVQSTSGTISIDLKSANTFGVKINQRL